jgi:glycerol-3-phosphate dehydrogenase (NAD+)
MMGGGSMLLLVLIAVLPLMIPAHQGTSSNGVNVGIIGSGNWATAIGRLVATNVNDGVGGNADQDSDGISLSINNTIPMWVYQGDRWEDQSLADVINERHENPKYLPGIPLPANLVAIGSLDQICNDCDVLVFCIPHQFMRSVLSQMRGKCKSHCKCLSLGKGLFFNDRGPELLSAMIADELGIESARVGVLAGANVANDVAADDFVESTFACDDGEMASHFFNLVKCLFQSPAFRLKRVNDKQSVEILGALKNVIAMGAGEMPIFLEK